jgi:pyridoxine 5'-phosphate synthase PdxJ
MIIGSRNYPQFRLDYIRILWYCSGMARILADLSQVERFYGGTDPRKEILRQCLSLEMAGVDSVLLSTSEDYNLSRVRLLELVKNTMNIGLTVQTSLDDKWIESLQEIKPSMVIFNYDDSRIEALTNYITRLQVEDIFIGFRIPDDMEYIKKAAKLKADYFILTCESFCKAVSLNNELDELNKIVKLASLGKKLSMGVISSGNFNKRKLKLLNDTGAIEEFMLGSELISESLLSGYAAAIQKIRSSLA